MLMLMRALRSRQIGPTGTKLRGFPGRTPLGPIAIIAGRPPTLNERRFAEPIVTAKATVRFLEGDNG